METKKSSRNVWIDIFRYFLAFLVICIHFVRRIGKFYILALFRLAVPMFFMISGFFAYSKDKDVEIKRCKKAIERNAIYLIITLSVAIVATVITLIYDKKSVSDYFYSIINPNIFFNFFIINYFPKSTVAWYMIALFITSIFHYFIVKYNKTKYYILIIPITILIHMFPYYYNLLGGDFIISLNYLRNWLFFGLPCFATGYSLRKFIIDKNNNKLYYGIIELLLANVFWALSLLEFYFLGNLEYFISILFSSICFLLFFDFLTKVNKSKRFEIFENKLSSFFYNWIGVQGAFFIFLTHKIIGDRIKLVFAFKKFYHNILLFLLCFIIYEILFLIVKLINKIRLNHKNKVLSLN